MQESYFLCLKYSISNVNYMANNIGTYLDNNPTKIINYGYYAIDLTLKAEGGSGTFTYKLPSICRTYGIDYSELTAADFIYGYIACDTFNTSASADEGHYGTEYNKPGPQLGTPVVNYDSELGLLTISNLYLSLPSGGSNIHANGGTSYPRKEQFMCMLVPQVVRIAVD